MHKVLDECQDKALQKGAPAQDHRASPEVLAKQDYPQMVDTRGKAWTESAAA